MKTEVKEIFAQAMRENGGKMPSIVYDHRCFVCKTLGRCEHREYGLGVLWVGGGWQARWVGGYRGVRGPAITSPPGSERRQEICRNAAIARHQRAQWAARDAQEVAT